ncbi:T9SS type A sorting domain-containing protein, partial [candidate division WOR-3 bacterium]|nr:T9SS type A sorting domain-containing protein [candidate division WOR-3 bacterium]
ASRMLGQDFTDGRWTGAAESQPPKTFDLKVKKNSIAFSVPCTVHVEIGLYDVSGRLIKPLINGNYGAGFYQVELEKTDISPGVYFVRMNACDFTETRKVVTL